MDLPPKCVWTGKRDPRVKSIVLKTLDRFSIPTEKTFYVLPEYDQNLRDYNNRFVNSGRFFLISILGLTVLLPVSGLVGIVFSFSSSIILFPVGIITSLIGVVIVLFPFTTPETVEWLGLKNGIIVARITGFVTIVVGIIICVLP